MIASVKEAVKEKKKPGSASVDLLIIGCSTGGPSAMQSILPRFTPDFPAGIVVVQHMPPGFTKPLADRFDTICNLSTLHNSIFEKKTTDLYGLWLVSMS
ncbi:MULTISPECIES: chemotaxis protein CheB [Brevibacillus]|uniref:chemotaxis protein CheB n=1 Tax=Brevibacillus TaxID=55080 RepID=UPI00256EFD4C|nr:chemotaxis protein CheB [Brevibacillus sp. NSP2.1]